MDTVAIHLVLMDALQALLDGKARCVLVAFESNFGGVKYPAWKKHTWSITASATDSGLVIDGGTPIWMPSPVVICTAIASMNPRNLEVLTNA